MRHPAPFMALLAPALLAALPADALAQVTPGPAPGATMGFSGDGSASNQNVNAFAITAPNSLGLRVTADFNYAMPRQNGSGAITYSGNYFFNVGPVPVQVNSWNFSYHAKWVNGGGSAATPTTEFDYHGFIREFIDVGQPRPIVLGGGVTNDSVVGNGLRVVNGGAGGMEPFILAANRTYILNIAVSTRIAVSDWNDNYPSVTLTHEAGGDLNTNFNGFALSFTYQTVPSPAGAGLLGTGALLLTRRRRR